MLHNVYGIFDSGTGTFAPPYFAPNETVGLRLLASIVMVTPQMQQHPEDFSLTLLGHFCDESGHLESTLTPVIDVESVVLTLKQKGQI